MDDCTPSAGAPFVPLRLVLQGSEVGVDLTRPDLVIGRHTDADLRLPLPDVSRRHCRFVFSGGCWQVFDLNSLNGVYVNGERVSQALLHHHDVVRIGSYYLEVDLESPAKVVRLDAGGPPRAPLVLQRIQNMLPPAERQAS
jgi:pSer/pThr/pTyr-binding forkhead associated (FHA) protein